jgi:protein ImuB
MKRIVSVWLPAWPIARLKRAFPKAVPPDKPFALVTSGAHGLLISAVNSCAVDAGVAVGARLTDARAAVPSLICRAAEPREDEIALLRLARWAGRYGPNRNTDGDDGLWIDITGVAHLYGGEEKLLDDLVQRLTRFGVPSHVGLADTFGAAHALARFGIPDAGTWALAAAGTGRAVFASFPVESLRLDAKSVLLLKRLGLRRAGQLYELPRESLARRFRSRDVAGEVLTRLDQMLGLKQEPRGPLAEPPVMSVRRAFAEPLLSGQAIETIAVALCEELSALLKEKGRGARSVRLSLYRADGTVAEVAISLRTPSRDGAHLMLLLKEKFDSIDAGFGIDLMVLDVLRARRVTDSQEGFSEDAAAADYDPGPLIDRLSNRLGADAVTILRSRASHIPERSEVRMAALSSPSPRSSRGEGRGEGRPLAQSPVAAPHPNPLPVALVRANGERGSPLTYEPPWPYGPYGKGPRRPPFVFARPEPISVVAEIPDGPPARFIWRRVERRIARAEGPERIAPEWWRAIGLGENQKRQRVRDYYDIEDETGARYWVFRHGLYGGAENESEDDEPPRWFLHGLFA